MDDVESKRRPGSHGEPMPEGEEAPPPGVRTMAIVRWGLLAAMVGLAGFAVVHVFLPAPAGEKAAIRYYCPMHPAVVSDRPGDCPICGMTLVPMPAAETAGEASQTAAPPESSAAPPNSAPVPGLVPVEIAPDRRQLIGLRTARAERRRIGGQIRTVGIVAAPEDGLHRIHARFSGWIDELAVTQTGQRIRKGEPLARIYSEELLRVQGDYLSARALAKAGSPVAGLAENARRRLELLGVSPGEIEKLEETGLAQRSVAIRSPVDGHVVRKSAVSGVFLHPGTELFEIADLSRVWVLVDVYEADIGRVAVGQTAAMTLAALPAQIFRGKLTFLYPVLDPASRTIKARLGFANPKLALVPGMFGDVVLETGAVEGVVVPREAVVDTGEHTYLFVETGPSRFEPRRVTTGVRADDAVQILSGVVEAESVVTSAGFFVDSESRLRAAVQGTAATTGGAP